MGKQVLVIGAGASGMTAAIQAARAGAWVTVLEHTDRAGRKLLSTGNGRCNLTNLDQRNECYRCGRAEFPGRILEQFPVEDTLHFFQELGILPKSRNGYIYPNSDQASSVLEALLTEMERLAVKVVYQCRIERIEKKQGLFLVASDQGLYQGDALILAAGSKAAPVTGSDGSGYELAASLGHRIITPLPALVQLRSAERHDKRLAGVRSDGRITLYIDGKEATQDTGELQLTDYGVSGIPTFQVSRYASVALHRRQKVTAVLNFLPAMSPEEVQALMKERFAHMGERSSGQLMNGLLNSKLSAVLLEQAGIREKQKVNSLTREQKQRLIQAMTGWEMPIAAVNSYENAQVCCGGVDTKQIDGQTLESRLVKGLYVCGEILDVDGICGGYNLQWAWSSGTVAGKNAAKGASGNAGMGTSRKMEEETQRKMTSNKPAARNRRQNDFEGLRHSPRPMTGERKTARSERKGHPAKGFGNSKRKG